VNVGALVLTAVLLVLNGCFVAVEFALMASRRTKLEALAEHGNSRARVALGSMRRLNLQLSGVQLGITMASLVLGYVAEPAVSDLVEDGLDAVVELPSGLLHGLGFTIALLIVSFLHMVVGEMIPKNIAIAAPERTMLALAVPNHLYVVVLSPLLRMLTALANAGVRLLGVTPRDELATAASAEELAGMLGESRDEGLIGDVAHQLLTGALRLRARPVRDVMAPRDGVAWLPVTATPAEAEALALASGHTRMLVADPDVDHLVGFVHVKDLLDVTGEGRHRPIPAAKRRALVVLDPATVLDDALLRMQRQRRHLAVVAGADGRTLGLVTLEDVIEALVGDIRDESDR
jgi:CBS domain containing-hemolysin-like protein